MVEGKTKGLILREVSANINEDYTIDDIFGHNYIQQKKMRREAINIGFGGVSRIVYLKYSHGVRVERKRTFPKFWNFEWRRSCDTDFDEERTVLYLLDGHKIDLPESDYQKYLDEFGEK